MSSISRTRARSFLAADSGYRRTACAVSCIAALFGCGTTGLNIDGQGSESDGQIVAGARSRAEAGRAAAGRGGRDSALPSAGRNAAERFDAGVAGVPRDAGVTRDNRGQRDAGRADDADAGALDAGVRGTGIPDATTTLDASAADGGVQWDCPNGVHTGNVTLASPGDVAMLRGCMRVAGDVNIVPGTLTNLVGLELLTTIDGLLLIGPSPSDPSTSEPAMRSSLTSLLGLEGLRSINGLSMSSLPNLRSIDALQGLNEIHTVLRISDCDALTSLAGLGTYAPAVGIENNDSLTSLTGSTPRRTPATVVLSNNPKLASITGLIDANTPVLDSLLMLRLPSYKSLADLRGVREIGNFALQACDGLVDLSGLESLQTANSIALMQLSGLKTLAALSGLQKITAGLYLNELPALATLQGMTQLQSVSTVFVNTLPMLVDLQGLEVLTELNDVEITSNDALTSLRGLEHVTRAAALRIARNAALPSLDGLNALTQVRALSLLENPKLQSLRALMALTTAETLEADGNTTLPQCEVEWLAPRLMLPVPAGTNGPLGPCP